MGHFRKSDTTLIQGGAKTRFIAVSTGTDFFLVLLFIN